MKERDKKPIIIGVACTLISLYLFGWIFPEVFWGTHFLAYLSPLSLTVIAVLILAIAFTPGKNLSAALKKLDGLKPIIERIAFTLLFGLLIFFFPILNDGYGDAFKFESFLSTVPTVVPEDAWDGMLELSLSPWAGQDATLGLITLVAKSFGITYKAAFHLFDLAFGLAFIFVWIMMVQEEIREAKWRFLLIIACLLAPVSLIFFRHIEVYAPVAFFSLVLMYSLKKAAVKSTPGNWILLAISFLFSLRVHPALLVYLPAICLAIIYHISGIETVNWKRISLFLFIPLILIWAGLYFFVFGDHVDDRSLAETAMEFDHLFLPIFSPQPPLDDYNLFSFHHLFDYLQEILLWSPVSLFLIGISTLGIRGLVGCNDRTLVVLLVALIPAVGLFFVINPLLSMPIDWDLIALPFPALLAVSLIIAKPLSNKVESVLVVRMGLIIVILASGFIVLHRSNESTAQRHEDLGFRIYSSYYLWTSNVLERSIKMRELSVEEEVKLRDAILKKMNRDIGAEVNPEYSTVLKEQAKTLLRELDRADEALAYLQKAYAYHPDSKNVLTMLVETYYRMENYVGAFAIAEEMVQKALPNEEKALKVAIQCGLEAGRYQATLEYSRRFLESYESAEISEVERRLAAKDRVESLRFLFNRK